MRGDRANRIRGEGVDLNVLRSVAAATVLLLPMAVGAVPEGTRQLGLTQGLWSPMRGAGQLATDRRRMALGVQVQRQHPRRPEWPNHGPARQLLRVRESESANLRRCHRDRPIRPPKLGQCSSRCGDVWGQSGGWRLRLR